MYVCPTAFDKDFFASILLALVTPGAGRLVMAISLTLQATRASYCGVASAVALSALIRTEPLGEVPEILFLGS